MESDRKLKYKMDTKLSSASNTMMLWVSGEISFAGHFANNRASTNVLVFMSTVSSEEEHFGALLQQPLPSHPQNTLSQILH